MALPFQDLVQIGPEMAAIVVPVVVFMIPIVAILTAHQRKMAEIIHSRQGLAQNPEIEALRSEVRELKELVHQQTLALDSYARPISTSSTSVESRS